MPHANLINAADFHEEVAKSYRSAIEHHNKCDAATTFKHASEAVRSERNSPMKILPLILLSGALTMGMANIAAAQDQAGPSASPNAPQNPAMKSPNEMTPAQLAKGHNSFTKAQALGRIQKAGYSNVQNLTLDADGLWQASAQQNGKNVQVALDYKGNVASQ